MQNVVLQMSGLAFSLQQRLQFYVQQSHLQAAASDTPTEPVQTAGVGCWAVDTLSKHIESQLQAMASINPTKPVHLPGPNQPPDQCYAAPCSTLLTSTIREGGTIRCAAMCNQRRKNAKAFLGCWQ